MRSMCREENNVVLGVGQARLTCCLAQHPFAAIAPYRIAQPLSSDEGDLASVAFVRCKNGHPHKRMVHPVALCEDPAKVLL